jgi:hypothetical protein
MSCRFFDLLPDHGAVSIISQTRSRREQQVLELAKHVYYYIVI